MRIAIITRALPAHGGGGMERLTADLAVRWSRAGHAITCFTTPLPSGGAPQLEAEGVDVRAVPGAPGRYSLAWRRRIRDAVDLNAFDLVLGVSSAAASLIGGSAPRRAPIVMQAHGTALAEIASKLAAPSLRSLAGIARNVVHLLEDLMHYPRYDGVIAVSRGVAADLERLPRGRRPTRIDLIPNGVDLATLPQDGRSLSPGQVPVVAFVGRLVREKGADLLVRALKDRPWTAVVVGAGRERERLERLARRLGVAERVMFTGSVTRSRAATLIAESDVVVVPSRRREGLPLVVLEAMASGRRLLVSRQIANSIPGVLNAESVLPALDAGALALAIERVLGAEAPAGEVPRQYDLDVCAEQYLRVFDELVPSGRSIGSAA